MDNIITHNCRLSLYRNSEVEIILIKKKIYSWFCQAKKCIFFFIVFSIVREYKVIIYFYLI